MSGDICSDNRFGIIDKVKEHLIKYTNIEMHPEEMEVVDSILFRLWQCGYFREQAEGREIRSDLWSNRSK